MAENKEKKKKHKHAHTDMHETATCCAKGCGQPIKKNLVERKKSVRVFCYLHHLLECGRTVYNGRNIQTLIKARRNKI
jgi:hypothetical protein